MCLWSVEARQTLRAEPKVRVINPKTWLGYSAPTWQHKSLSSPILGARGRGKGEENFRMVTGSMKCIGLGSKIVQKWPGNLMGLIASPETQFAPASPHLLSLKFCWVPRTRVRYDCSIFYTRKARESDSPYLQRRTGFRLRPIRTLYFDCQGICMQMQHEHQAFY